MTHLSPSEFIDLLEKALAPGRAAHLDTCAECRTAADAARQALQAVAVPEVPEPSPLFWDHLSARIRESAAEPPRAAPWWRGAAAVLAWSAAAVLIAIVSVQQGARHQASPAPDATVATPAGAGEVAPDTDDAAFELLTIAASDLEMEDARAAGLGVRPTTVDTAVLELTPAEREELGRLLKDEIRRAGA